MPSCREQQVVNASIHRQAMEHTESARQRYISAVMSSKRCVPDATRHTVDVVCFKLICFHQQPEQSSIARSVAVIVLDPLVCHCMHSNESVSPMCILPPNLIASADMYIHSSCSDDLHPCSGCLQALGRQLNCRVSLILQLLSVSCCSSRTRLTMTQWDAKDLHKPVWACHLSFATIKHPFMSP